MLQQTRVEAVRDAYRRFMERLPDIRSLAEVPDDELMKLWEGLGYYRRARGLKKAAETILTDYNGSFPETEEELLTLPGVGRYTAGAVGSIAFGLPVPAVDGNVMRVMARIKNDDENVLNGHFQSKTERELRALMQEHFHENGLKGQGNPCGDFNQSLFELGACLCMPKDPHCSECPVADFCEAHLQGTAGQLPVRIKQERRRKEKRTIVVVTDGKLIGIRKRPSTGLLAGLYEFINLEGDLDEESVIACVRELGMEPVRICPLPNVRHLFSHVEWDMSGYEVLIPPPDNRREGGLIFAAPEEIMETYAVPSAYQAYLSLYVHTNKAQRIKEKI